MTTDPFAPLLFSRGPAMPNRFMLAPLTNLQSHADGSLSDAEQNWLTMRAEGGFGLTMTCAAQVMPSGQGFAGQLAISSDAHLPGLTRLAAAIRAAGSRSSVQLHHAGRRSPADLIGMAPSSPWDDPESGARALTTGEVEEVIEAFILAGLRAERAGFDGVEIHGAHGYLLAQFLDGEHNRRGDAYGGSFANRRRVLDSIVEGLRARTGPEFQIGVRLSPERYGIEIREALELAESLMTSGRIDYLDMSLWDCRKLPEDPEMGSKPLIEWFTQLPRGTARLGVAGKIMSGADVAYCLDSGADFVLLGRAAILHHDFPKRMRADSAFSSVPRPVTRDYLRGEGLSEPFVEYMASWQGFVEG
jgi:2,4-dienoyl-CoA reductase-like NADH-dependent reductase (Old Yellow Enzyme family)